MGKFILSAKSNTLLHVLDLHGTLLATIDTHLGNNVFAATSPCGRFIACCGFTAEVKVWEAVYTKSADFSEVRRAFDLTGHHAGVTSFGFNADSTR